MDFDSRGQSSCVDENGPLHVSNPQNETTSISHKGHDVGTEGIQGISQKTSNPFVTPNIYPNSGGNHSFHVDDVDDDVADQHARLMDNNEITYDQDHAQPLQPFDGDRRLRSSQVIRKVNSGFQILRPGTLDPPQQTKGLTEWTGDLGGTNKRESKKRQRRGRAPSRSSYTLED